MTSFYQSQALAPRKIDHKEQQYPQETDALVGAVVLLNHDDHSVEAGGSNCNSERSQHFNERPRLTTSVPTMTAIFAAVLVAFSVVTIFASGPFDSSKAEHFPLSSSPPSERLVPTDQIQVFLNTWKAGRCGNLAALVGPNFEYRVTAFGGDDRARTEKDPFVFSLDEFIESLCRPYAGHFVIQFEQHVHHTNLGQFGTIRAFGSDFYVDEDNALCLAPYYASFAATLDSQGRLQVLQELVHNVETYNAFSNECINHGFTLSGTKHRLLDSKSKLDDAMHVPTQRRVDDATALLNLYSMGKCDEMTPFLAPSFAFQSYNNRDPIHGVEKFVEACRYARRMQPVAFHPTVALTDGSRVTLIGPSLHMTFTSNGELCPTFAQGSFLITYSEQSPALVEEIFVTVDDSTNDNDSPCHS